ncbi:uncharacterized protein LOC131623743 [Vicia villosa]|uniref:uncharacterized protein LOC131623743 n=1 Tax=Vicia villosa TaxID=3911 RepID=UPI00273B599D|nr:uncharacterized protein LOC131623743 [Vicia villosa]
MGGSKSSSTNDYGVGLPKCGCNMPMKMWVSKSIDNPGKKFWKCKNMMDKCGLFLWDDLIKGKDPNPSRCLQCDGEKKYLRELANEIVDEMECRARMHKKMEKQKRKIANERKNFWLMVIIGLSWIMFSALIKLV